MKIIKICKIENCNNKVKVNRNDFCSKICYYKSLIGHTFNKGKKRTEEQNRKNSEIHKGRKHTKEEIQKQIEAQMGHFVSEETKQKIREAHLGMETSEKTRKKQSLAKQGKYFGENNPNWNGGTSFEFYPKEFKQIKSFILERDNYTCQDPNCEHKSIKLHVHHIDYDKKNNNPENLITLCNECHGQTVGKNNREYWITYHQNIMISRFIECLL